MVNVINSAKFDYCNSIGLDLARVKIFHFPMLDLTAHTTELALTRCLWNANQTNRVTVIKLGRLDNVVDHVNKWSKVYWDRAKGSVPTARWNISLLWLFMHGFPFLSFRIIFLLTSTGRTGKPISMVDGSNDAFLPKEVPFWGLIKKLWLCGVSNPEKPRKSGRGLWFPSHIRKFNKNSYLSQIETYQHTIWTVGGNKEVHIRFRVKSHLSFNARWRQPPLWKISDCNNSVNFRLISIKFDE
jgi:hypothetical protein